jgi:hypothetical protein
MAEVTIIKGLRAERPTGLKTHQSHARFALLPPLLMLLFVLQSFLFFFLLVWFALLSDNSTH